MYNEKRSDKIASFSEVTDVTFRKLTDSEIIAYADTDEPYDKAGGYGIQGKGSLYVERIKGDFYTIMGLPICRLNKALSEL